MYYLSSENFIFHILIAIPTFFIVSWLLSKLIKEPIIKRIAAILFTIILTPLLYLVTVTIFFSVLFHEPTRKFDQKLWLADKTKRYQMAGDIINNKLLIGKDTNQVKSFFGDINWGGNIKWNNDSVNYYTYDLGIGGGGLGFMNNYLVIKFDKGRVTSVEHQAVPD